MSEPRAYEIVASPFARGDNFSKLIMIVLSNILMDRPDKKLEFNIHEITPHSSYTLRVNMSIDGDVTIFLDKIIDPEAN